MEPNLECILSLLDLSLDDLDNVDGHDFCDLINRAVQCYDRISKEVYETVSRGQVNLEEVIVRVEKWNNGLRNLIEKVNMDADLQRITKLQCNTLINLSEEENNALKVKKKRRTKDLKIGIDKLIIKLDELLISLEESSSTLNDTEFISKNSSNIFEDIERRYNEAMIAEQNIQDSENITFLNNDNDFTMKNKSENKDKENDERYENIKPYDKEEIKKEQNQNIMTESNHNRITTGLSQSQNSVMKKKTIDDFTKDFLDNFQVYKGQQIDPSRLENHDELSDQMNWTKLRYTNMYGEFSDMDLGCMISMFKGSPQDKEKVIVHIKNLDDVPMMLDSSYEVLSNLVQLEPANLEVEFNNDIPWKISIPYLMIRNASKEVVIICYDMTTERQMILESQDVIFDDNKEGGFKLAEASLPSPNCICVVVSKRKIERFKADKRGTKFVSNIDPRVVLTMSQNFVKIKVNIEISVLQIESGHLNELLTKNALNNLYAMSPVVEIKSDYTRNLLRTISIQVPIPNTLSHSSRGRAISARPQVMDKAVKRSKSAITRQISTEEDPVIKVGTYNNQDKIWRTNNNLNFLVNKNKDAVEIELQNLHMQKIVVVRCDESFNDDHLYRSMDIINKNLETRVVQVIIRQHTVNSNRIVVVVASPNRIDKIQKHLTKENFGEETSIISSEFVLRERSKLKIDCKGNLKMDGDSTLIQIYNSQLPNRVEFSVKEIDKFAQKSKDSFQGFVVISEITQRNSTKLWEAVINIPKNDLENKKGFKMLKDFEFQSTDIINKHYLLFLSQQLGKDWIALGKSLKVADVSIRRISNDPFIDSQTMAYECLLKWIKNSTVYSKKMIIMEKALRSIGRFDLVQDLAKRVLNGR